LPYIENQVEFETRQNCNEKLFLQGRFVYSSGSVWVPTSRHTGNGLDPPQDEEELNELLTEYHQHFLEIEVTKVHNIIQNVRDQDHRFTMGYDQTISDDKYPNWRQEPQSSFVANQPDDGMEILPLPITIY